MNRIVVAWYRVALWLYPAGLRRRYGQAMVDEAAAMLRDGAVRGARGWLAAVFRLTVDTVASLAREWSRLGLPARRPSRRWLGQSGWLTDLLFAARGYRRAPVFTIVAVTTLALGIGANVALFGVIDSVLLKPLRYPAPDRLVAVWPGQLFSQALVDRVRAETTTFAGIAGHNGTILTLTEAGEPAELVGTAVPAGHFGAIAIPPMIGRSFAGAEHVPGATPVAMLTHELWLERFGGDPAVLGRTVALAGEGASRRTVVGVMPPGYRALLRSTDVWIPEVVDRSVVEYDDSNNMTVIARLRPDVTMDQANAAVATMARRARADNPAQYSEEEVARAGVVSLKDALVGDLRPRLIALMSAVSLVLLVGCLNVANLLLARNRTRSAEIAVRTALGANRGRLVRQLFTESALLAAVGGAAGVAAAWVTRDVLLGVLPGIGPEMRIEMNLQLLGFAVLLSCAASVLVGVAPGWQASGADPGDALREGRASAGKSVRRSHYALLGVEVALATVLVFGAGLLVKSVWHMVAVPPGFDAAGVLTFRVTAPSSSDDDVRTLRYFDAVRAELATVPGVEAVGLVSRLPMAGGISRITMFPEGYEPVEGVAFPTATHRLVSPGYLEALGVRFLAGRDISEAEARGGPLRGVVNRALAERFWPGEDPVGKVFYGRGGVTWLEVVGVVDDVREDGPTEAAHQGIYLPHRDWAWRTMNVVLRTGGDPLALVEPVKHAVWRVDRGVPITRMRTLEQIVDRAVENSRLTAVLATAFAALALVLGAVGVAGVVAHTVAERRREFGIRTALGAPRGRLVRDQLVRTGWVLSAGIALGVAGALVVGRLLESLIFGVNPSDPVLLAVVAATLALVGLGAAYLPARRGTRVDPVHCLRS